MNEYEKKFEHIKVLVVDDHPIFRTGICERLKTPDGNIEVVGEGSNGIEAIELAKKLQPKVILMDVSMPEMNGIEATKKITRDFPNIEVIMLSVYDDDQYVNAALESGASGYLLKTVEGQELRDSIYKVIAGGSALSPLVARRVISRISKNIVTDKLLTDREIQVLQLAAKGVTNKYIARTLFVSIRTVETHMHNIFEKLGVSSRTEAVTDGIREKIISLDGTLGV